MVCVNGHTMPASARFCPDCGARARQGSKAKPPTLLPFWGRILMWIGAGALGLMILAPSYPGAGVAFLAAWIIGFLLYIGLEIGRRMRRR